MVALSLAVLVLMTAFAVDLGRQRADRRDMQASADVIALDMSRLANGRTIADIHAGNGATDAVTALSESAARNAIDVEQLVAEFGHWDGTTFTTYSTLFPTGPVVNTSDTDIPNAARVTASETTDYNFQPGSGESTRHAIAQYGVEPTAAFQVGSFGIDVIDEGILNALLSGVLGSPVNLSVLHYEGLATANITLSELLSFIDLPDVGVPLSALSPQEALDVEITLEQLYVASVQALENQGDTATASLLNDLISIGVPEIALTLGQLVSLGTPATDSALDLGLNVLGLVQAGALVAHCPTDTTPDDFADDIDCSAIALPDIDVGLPGLADIGASVKVIQKPIVVAGPEGTSKNTGQVQVGTDADLGTTELPCPPALELLCVGSILPVDVGLGLDVRVAGGPNTIEDIDCSDPNAEHLLVSSVTNLLDIDLSLGTSIGVMLGGFTVISVDVTTTVSTLQEGTSGQVMFDVPPDVLGQTTKGTGQGDIGISPFGIDVEVAVTQLLDRSGVTSLLNDVLSLVTDVLLENFIVNTLVNPLLQGLDNLLLGPLTDLLGLNIVGSDLTPLQINCNEIGVELVE